MELIENLMKDIAIFGAGGFGREVACLINRINRQQPDSWNFIGFFDDDEKIWGAWNDYGKVLGGIDVLNSWDTPLNMIIAIGNVAVLELIDGRINNPNVIYPNLIDPNVEFMDPDRVEMGHGNVICMRSTISTNVKLGNFNILNTAVGVGHDVIIGHYNVFMPSTNLSGGVVMGDCNFLGVQSVVLQYVKIGKQTRIGANSVVIRNTKDGFLYIGNPAKRTVL